MITAFFFHSFCSFFNVIRHTQRRRFIHFTTGRLLYPYHLRDMGLRITAKLDRLTFSFFLFPMCSFNVLFCFIPFSPSRSLDFTLHVALPSGTETLIRHYILIPFLFGRVYQAGTYFVGNHQAKRVYDKLWHWESH